jgi:hypothetical protein
MAKRGETRPWKVSFHWENGVHGTDSKASEDEARMLAESIHRTAETRGMRVDVAVTHRPKATR